MKSSENGAAPAPPAYEFGEFILDRRELRRRDRTPVPLTPRLLDTLRYLVEHNDKLLDKEEIMEAVWPDAIVEENNLSQAISKLRQVLGEKPGAEFIATIPRRGYRFVARVRITEAIEPERLAAEKPAFSKANANWRRRSIVGTAVALLLIAVVAYFWWERSKRTPSPDAAALSEKSIAVLPFDNLSSDKADAFFADGIQDDILTSLGKIRDLKVIARASTQDYRGTPSAVKLREIARALGASHVLEGSVRRLADRVVVDVALIDTRDQRQVWAERYDRTLTDTLSLQGELAVEIARELRANLTPLESTAATMKPTQDAEAYVFYLRGRDAETGPQKPVSHLEALHFYQQAIERDPGFALARARLSVCASYLFAEGTDPQWKAKARTAADEVVRLQPLLGEGHLALALCYLWGDNDDDRALAELNRTAEFLPNSAEVPLVAAYIHKRHNRFAERVAALAHAESLDPRNRMVLSLTHLTHRWMRNWAEAIRALDRRSLAWPEDNYPVGWERVQDEFYLIGDISVLERGLAREAKVNAANSPAILKFAGYSTAMLKRDYAAAAERLAGVSQTDLDQLDFAGPKSFHEAILLLARGADPAITRQALTLARDDCRARLEIVDKHPPNQSRELLIQIKDNRAVAPLRVCLALIDAFLGRREDAKSAASDALSSTEFAGALEENQIRAALALVYAQTGESDKAIDLIETLLKLPAELPDEAFLYNITLANLKVGWQWDPLRHNPRFQKLLNEPEPKSAL